MARAPGAAGACLARHHIILVYGRFRRIALIEPRWQGKCQENSCGGGGGGHQSVLEGPVPAGTVVFQW